MSVSLLFDGDIELNSDISEADGYQFQVLASSRRGDPVPVEVTLSSLMRDGAIVRTDGSQNREVTLQVRVTGADLLTLALGEARLKLATEKRTTLVWTPADGIGPATVFEVMTSNLTEPQDDGSDLAELRNQRTYGLRLVCLPYTRSATPTIIGSEFVADSETIADNCESTSGWSVYGTGQTATITVDSTAGHFVSGTGAVKFVVEPYNFDAPDIVTAGYASVSAKIRKSGLSIDASGGGYFVFRHRPEPGWDLQSYTKFYLTSSGGGRQEATLVSAVADVNGYTKYALMIPNNSTITAFEIDGAQSISPLFYGSQPANPGWWFDALGLASGASENQAARTLAIGGSARGEGTLAVSAAVGLGDVLLYTARDLGDGFRPDWRRFQTGGTSTTDTDAMNGSYVPADTGVFEVPAATLRPGAYAVLARVKGAGLSVALDIAAQTVLAGTPIGQTYTLASTMTLPDTTGYHVVRLGVLDLPPHRVDAAASAVVRFTLSGTSTLRVDEILTFPLEDAALTWVECGSGSPSSTVASRLWIDGPSADLPFGQIVVGNDVNRADARFIQPRSRGKHLLYPGRMLAYLLTSAAGGAELATSYFKRWHTWAGE